MITALVVPGAGCLRRHLRLGDYLHFLLYTLRHPSILPNCLRSVERDPGECWRYLDTHTAARAAEARAQGRTGFAG